MEGTGKGGLAWEERLVLALVFDGGQSEWEAGSRRHEPVFENQTIMIRKQLHEGTGVKISLRTVFTAFREASAICKPIYKSCQLEGNRVIKQEFLDGQDLWMEGLGEALYTQNVKVFKALFGSGPVSDQYRAAEALPTLTVQQQTAARARIDFYSDALVQKLVSGNLEMGWREWGQEVQNTQKEFTFSEKTDLRVDPCWPVNSSHLTWIQNEIRDRTNDGRMDWWRRFHEEGLFARFKDRRLARLFRIFKALMQMRDKNSTDIELFESLYSIPTMQTNVQWFKKISMASEPLSDEELHGLPSCVASVYDNLSDLKQLFCILAFVSQEGNRNSDLLYESLNADQEAVLIKKYITVDGLQIMGTTIANSSESPPQYLLDPQLYNNMVRQANNAEYRASNTRPGTSGIEFQHAFLEVMVHAVASRALILPLQAEFNPEDHTFSGDKDLRLMEEMQRQFRDGGLLDEADAVCGDGACENFNFRKRQYWTEVHTRRNNLDMQIFVLHPSMQAGINLGKRAPPAFREDDSEANQVIKAIIDIF